jgi:hypothetical protein
MTEQELINLGFDRVEVSDSESQNGYDYYYYVLDLLPGLSLISSGNDESQDGWCVYNFDWINGDKITKDSILHLKEVAVAQGYLGQHLH